MKTETEYQIAVCQALGWKNVKMDVEEEYCDDATEPGYITMHYLKGDSPLGHREKLPPLTLDLMASARATLTEEEQVEYVLRLNEIVRRGKPIGDGIKTWDNINATKYQHADAFLRVKGML